MFKFEGELEVGLNLIYDGEPIEWINPKTGRITDILNKGAYVITKLKDGYIFVRHDRKNATTIYKLDKNDINSIWCLEFDDLTTFLGFFQREFEHHNWWINDKELINKAKKHNKLNR